MFPAEAYIFDFDGVIADSMSMHQSAWKQAHLDVFGSSLANIERIAGLDSIRIAHKLAHEAQKQNSWREFLARKRELVLGLIDTIALLPGAAEFLDRLRQDKILHAICTNATEAFLCRVLGNHNLEVPPHITVDQVTHPKPHPEPYLEATQLLGISPALRSQVIAFEDSRHGLRSAKTAGLYCIGISSMHSKEELTSAGAKEVYPSLAAAFVEFEKP
jgi:HAD superfamily hydrolase (TIGR01509 family)